jgi:hypothetical protein
LLELNGFTLEASDRFKFHALLAIDADGGAVEWRNWSYWHVHFDRLTLRQARATGLYDMECLPQVDFILKLPLLAK